MIESIGDNSLDESLEIANEVLYGFPYKSKVLENRKYRENKIDLELILKDQDKRKYRINIEYRSPDELGVKYLPGVHYEICIEAFNKRECLYINKYTVFTGIKTLNKEEKVYFIDIDTSKKDIISIYNQYLAKVDKNYYKKIIKDKVFSIIFLIGSDINGYLHSLKLNKDIDIKKIDENIYDWSFK